VAQKGEESAGAAITVAQVRPRARALEVALQQRHARRAHVLLRRPKQQPQHAPLRLGAREGAAAVRLDGALVQLDGRREELDAAAVRRGADVRNRLSLVERPRDACPDRL
jgi:hypothetical protein